MAIGDIYRADILFEAPSGIFFGEVVLNYRQETATVASSPSDDLALAILQEALEDVMNPLPGAFVCNEIHVRGVTNPTEGIDSNFPDVAGTQAGETYDVGLGLRMIWRTGLIGRSFQGRSTFPPTTETNIVSTGVLNTGFRGNAQVLLSSLINLPETASHAEWQLGVLSRVSGGVERPTPLFTPVTVGELQPRQGWLRQRRD